MIYEALNIPVNMWNSYEEQMGRIEVSSGLKSRLSSSIVPVLREGDKNSYDKTSLVMCAIDPSGNVGASVEIRLQPCDAKIPFSNPELDRLERAIGNKVGAVKREPEVDMMLGPTAGAAGEEEIRPYLCNLFTTKSYRSKGLGRTLTRLSSFISMDVWGYDELYLHCDYNNENAVKLYGGEGWRDVGRRWKPGWEGLASGIGYFVKKK